LYADLFKESIYDQLVHPKQCFCHVPKEELKKWAVKRYCDHSSTMELLASTRDPHEKEIISIIALLDVAVMHISMPKDTQKIFALMILIILVLVIVCGNYICHKNIFSQSSLISIKCEYNRLWSLSPHPH